MSACLGGQVRVWDAETHECVAVLRSNYGARPAVPAPWCIAAVDEMIAVGRGDGDVEVGRR